MSKSQVKLTLKIKHSDFSKIRPLCRDIKHELVQRCPKLIHDGSRPFEASLRDIFDDHLAVVVDARFHVRPAGRAYWALRDEVLHILLEMVQKHEIVLACPMHRVVGDVNFLRIPNDHSGVENNNTAAMYE